MRSDDRGSLPLAMLAVLVASMLGALILPLVLTANRSTRFDVTRVHSLHAAQSGIDVMLGLIRAASTDSNGTVVGDPTKLPCYDSGSPLTGTANGTGQAAYSVSVAYYVANPAAGATPMVCSSNFGTYDSKARVASPRYAVITATGTDGTVDSGSKGRALASTYIFSTDDTSAAGGQLRIYPTSGSTTPWCMDAGSATPTAGTPVTLRACTSSTPPTAQQVFLYRSDLSIQLVSSVTTDQPTGLCIDTSPTAHSAGVALVLKACTVATPDKCASITSCSQPNQQWTLDEGAHLRGTLTDRSNTDSYCINAPSQSDGVGLVLQTCAGGSDSAQQAWLLTPTAGTGMAGPGYKQLVNGAQSVRCLDVTSGTADAQFLITYPCKANPNPSNLAWNQQFTPSPALAATATTTLLTTTAGGTTYCLTSPLTVGGNPRLSTPCPTSASVGNAASWVVNQSQDAGGGDLPYAQKSTIVDSNGLCLGPGSDNYSGYPKVVVAKCDGSAGQKWNLAASQSGATLTNTHEVP